MINIINDKVSIEDVEALIYSLSKHIRLSTNQVKYYRKGLGKKMFQLDPRRERKEINEYKERARLQIIFAIRFLGDLTVEDDSVLSEKVNPDQKKGKKYNYKMLDSLKERLYKYLNAVLGLHKEESI